MKFRHGCLELVIGFVGIFIFVAFFFGVIIDATGSAEYLSENENMGAFIGFIMIACILFILYWYDNNS